MALITDKGHMRLLLFLWLGLYSGSILALSCDCDLLVFSPMTGSHKMPAATLKTYELENYATKSVASQNSCKKSCLDTFTQDMKGGRLKSLLTVYAQRLVTDGAVGFNCTGLTTLQFPVVVKANLGNMSMGNVYRSMEVITHEEACFY